MRVLFCNIAWMNYYKGNHDGTDVPHGGGSYVNETEDAHEKYNFEPVHLMPESGYPENDYCLGFVETKSTNRTTSNQLSIEKIEGCELLKKENQAENVLVIYCAAYPFTDVNETYVVGWYKHATVYRYYETLEFASENPEENYYQNYNAIAKAEDCVLLPRGSRRSTSWRIPRRRKGISYGFGQANVWFAQNRESDANLQAFLNRISSQIENYDGENWLDAGYRKETIE